MVDEDDVIFVIALDKFILFVPDDIDKLLPLFNIEFVINAVFAVILFAEILEKVNPDDEMFNCVVEPLGKLLLIALCSFEQKRLNSRFFSLSYVFNLQSDTTIQLL